MVDTRSWGDTQDGHGTAYTVMLQHAPEWVLYCCCRDDQTWGPGGREGGCYHTITSSHRTRCVALQEPSGPTCKSVERVDGAVLLAQLVQHPSQVHEWC
jgi:hypothetical protein